MLPRATIEIEYIDGSLRVIARDSRVTERLINIMDKLSTAKVKENIANIQLGYCNEWQSSIMGQIKYKPLLNP